MAINIDSKNSQQIRSGKNEIFVDGKNKAEMLNEYFSEVCTKLKNAIIPTNFDPLELIESVNNEMELGPTSEDEIKNIIDNLNDVVAGHDQSN